MTPTNRLRFDNAVGTIAEDLDAGATTLVFSQAPNFGVTTIADPDYVPLVIDPPTGDSENDNFEIVWVTAYTPAKVDGNVQATILRGQEGTGDGGHNSGATWLCGPTVADFQSALSNNQQQGDYTLELTDAGSVVDIEGISSTSSPELVQQTAITGSGSAEAATATLANAPTLGNVLIAMWNGLGSDNQPQVPSGWDVVTTGATSVTGGNYQSEYIATRVVQQGDGESYVFGATNNQQCVVSLSEWSGITGTSRTSEIDSTTPPNSGEVLSPVLTGVVEGDLVIVWCDATNSSGGSVGDLTSVPWESASGSEAATWEDLNSVEYNPSYYAAAVAGYALAGASGSYQAQAQIGGNSSQEVSIAIAFEAGTVGTGSTLTIPTNADVDFPVGALVDVCDNGSETPILIDGDTGVELDLPPGAIAQSAGQWATMRLRQREIDKWVLSGDLAS